jgi:large conductance mechanosensitive channel
VKVFKQFILRGNVVDLAIAVVIGVAFANVVQALVRDILTPFIAAIFGKPDFSSLTFTIHHSRFLYGDVINYVITFLSIAIAIYLVVVLPLNALAERRARGELEEGESPLPSDEAGLLTEIRDLLASRTEQSS